jgi:hypothetical protein
VEWVHCAKRVHRVHSASCGLTGTAPCLVCRFWRGCVRDGVRGQAVLSQASEDDTVVLDDPLITSDRYLAFTRCAHPCIRTGQTH